MGPAVCCLQSPADVRLGPALAISAVGGAAVGCLADVRATDALAAAVAALSLLCVVRHGVSRRALLCMGLTGFVMAEGALARERALDPPLVRALQGGSSDAPVGRDPVLVVGRLARDAEQADEGVGLLVDVDEIRHAGGILAGRGRVRLHVSGELARTALHEWSAGRSVRVRATLRTARTSRNPGGPSLRWQALRRGHVLTGSVKSAALVEVERGSPWHEAAAAVRHRVRAAAAQYVGVYDQQSAAVVTAILIGDRAGLSPAVERRLQVAGTYHVIAISGGNIALVTALCFFALRTVLRSRRLVSIGTLVIVVAYGWMVGADPSVLRAVTAAALVLAVHAAGLVPEPVHLVSAAALLLVLLHPMLVLDVGAWLSFGATLGIVIGAARLVSRLGARLGRGLLGRLVLVPAVALLAATVCAEVTLLPVHAAAFSRVGVAGLVLNFLAIPAMACVQVAGLVTVALSSVSAGAAAWSGFVAHGAAWVLVGSAHLVEVWPWLSITVPPSPAVWAVAYYASLLAVITASGWPMRRRCGLAGLLLSAAVLVCAPGVERAGPSSGVLRVTLIDVGQGDAVLVQFPDRHTLLVDAGGSVGSYDVGRRVVMPAAWALGVRKLDWLLVTHPDIDHVGGARSVLEGLAAQEVWEGVPVPTSAARIELVEALRRRDGVLRTVRAGHRLEVGGVEVEMLHPPEPDWERRDVRNDDSVVIRLRYGHAELLLTGDAGGEFESAWRPPADLGPLRVLKAGHHGSRSSSGAAFVTRYVPDIALVSAGQSNLFGHPHPDVLAQFEEAGAAVFRTDVDGAIIVETDGLWVDVRGMSGRRFRLEISRASS